MSLHVFRMAHRERGQDLIELSLLFALIVIAIIGVVVLFRKDVLNSYCSVLYTISPDAQDTPCKSPIVTCEVQSWSASRFSLEVHVLDPDAPANSPAGSTIDHVAFYVNGEPWHDWAGDGIDRQIPYCFPGGTSTCDSTALPSRTKVSAIAFDRNGNSGECSVRVP